MITPVGQAVLLGDLAVRVVLAVPLGRVAWAVREWAQAVPVGLVK